MSSASGQVAEVSDGSGGWRTYAAVGTTVLLWASAFVAIRSAGEFFSPGALALGRLLAGSATLVVLLLIRREGWPDRRAWPGILISGVLWFGGYMVALNWGEQEVDAGTAAMLVNIGPILMALLAGWILKEGFSPRVLVGIGVSFAGAVVVGISTSGGEGASVLGVILCVVAAITYAGGVVSQKPALRYASASQVTTFGCLVGTVACLPFSWQLVTEIAVAPPLATANVIYLGVFPTALAFTTWAYALARTPAGKMGSTTYVVPAIVIVMSWLLLGEIPALLTFVGGILCLAGVAVSRSRSRRRRTGLGSPAVAGSDGGAADAGVSDSGVSGSGVSDAGASGAGASGAGASGAGASGAGASGAGGSGAGATDADGQAATKAR